ncbi:MAG: hypothetical protein NC331_12360 [Lachnospiraceae bacterium]|nr:hypothetical protein [Lachnospiraceae bacterium]MCM1240161.1 hypothetical protein [Lachnospiraceae bacterium]
MAQTSAMEKIYYSIEQEMEGQITFYTDDVQNIFPGMKRTTLYWYLSKLVENGYLKRIRNGVYSLNEWKGKNNTVLFAAAQDAAVLLDEAGFNYYISGVDILLKYMQHVPEQYPLIIFAERAAREEVESVLGEAGLQVVEPARLKEQYENSVLTGDKKTQVVLYTTENFEYSSDNIATIEKAFVDLYFSVTRNGYPVALQELVRIYQNLVRLGAIDKKKMIRAAEKRSIQYDIRFIAESKFITEDAMTFVDILRKEE